MKKLLALILLSPLAHSEVTEYYCDSSKMGEYLTLKIDDDLNNPSFVIENHISSSSAGRYNFVADTNNIKVMPLTILVSTNGSFGFRFERATASLTRSWWNSTKANKKSLKSFNEFVKSDSTSTKSGEYIGQGGGDYYSCQPYISN